VPQLRLVVPDHPRPGWLPGALLGLAAGLLLASIWLFGASDVALAVTAVFVGMATVLITGASGWRAFGTGLLAAALVAGGALVVVGEVTPLGS
jgi:hypothetical protein